MGEPKGKELLIELTTALRINTLRSEQPGLERKPFPLCLTGSAGVGLQFAATTAAPVPQCSAPLFFDLNLSPLRPQRDQQQIYFSVTCSHFFSLLMIYLFIVVGLRFVALPPLRQWVKRSALAPVNGQPRPLVNTRTRGRLWKGQRRLLIWRLRVLSLTILQ